MICKVATITHSSNALDYCEKGGELIHANGVDGNSKEINSQFKEIHALKPNIKHKGLHAIISFNPEDRELNRGEMIDVAEKYAKQHGFDKNQYAVYLHEDKAHKHLHIVANRIGLDRKVLSSSHSYAKNTEFSKNIEKEYSLIQTNRKEKGKDFKSYKNFAGTMKIILDDVLTKSKSMEELSKNLKEQYCVTMYKGRGVSFMYQEKNEKAYKIKGSEIGREYSLKGLEKQIENIHFPKKLSDDFMQKFNSHLEEQKTDKLIKSIDTPSKSTGVEVTKGIEQGLGGLISGSGSGEMEEEPRRKKKRKWGNDHDQGGGMSM